ncbi:MAG: GntR family transcriptional regulator, partial [Bacillota bacterium]
MVQSIKVATKSELVYNMIKEDIIKGNMEPGERYSINNLAKEFEISRSPVYEAVKLLEAEDIVTIIPNVGFKINQLTRKEIKDLLSIQGALEELAIRKAMDKITDEELSKLRDIIDQTEKYIKEEDLDAYSEANEKFHFNLYQAARSSKLVDALENYWRHEIWYTQNMDDVIEYIFKLIDDHRKLINILEEK